MFETMQKVGVAVNIDTPDKPIEKREFASNIVNAYKGRGLGWGGDDVL